MEEKSKIILDTMKLYRLTHRRVHLELSASLNKSGLTPIQFNILEILYHQGELSMGDIMKQLCATKGNMTVVIKNMIDRGWIYRNTSTSDKRSCVIGLLPQGIQKTEEYLPIHQQSIEKIYESFTTDELLLFGTLLNKMK